MIEEWKDIKGYENLYKISNAGKVFSKRTNKILKHGYTNLGYAQVQLSYKGERHTKFIHRLIAEHFIENPNNYNCVNHKDFNPQNNKIDNLEWCSQKYNVLYSRERMSKIRKKYKTTNTGIKYIQIKNNKFRVSIKKFKIDRSFKQITDAINFRNNIIKENEKYFKGFIYESKTNKSN